MAEATLAAPLETPPSALAEAPVPAPADPPPSVADHAASFSPGAQRADPDEDEAAPETNGNGRHRASSQFAKAKDIDAINQYTRELRETQEALGITKKPGESARVFGLRAQAEMAKALRDLRKPEAPAAAVVAPPPPVRPDPPAAGKPFAEPVPTLEQFANEPDPYKAQLLAEWDWRAKKQAHDAAQTQTTAQIQEADQKFVQWAKSTTEAHDARLSALLAANPQAKQIFIDAIAKDQVEFSPIMQVAVEMHEQGPEMLLMIAQNPDLADSLFLQTGTQLAFDHAHRMNPLVATVQRRLVKELQSFSGTQAGTTGSAAAPSPVTIAPRPLNPVRTVPQTPSDTPPPEGSISDHARAYGPKPKRR